MKSNEKLLNRIETEIRLSQFQKATKSLLILTRKKLSNEELIRFSRFACRVGQPDLGIRKLKNIVRPTNRKSIIATPPHLVEYAICLIRLGACAEAKGLLKNIDTKTFPEALPVWGALHFREWDLQPAIAVFRTHVAVLPPNDYQTTVSKINLSMALIYEDQFNEAATLLNEIITNQENWQYPLLKGNCYRLLGVLELNRGNYEVALSCLHKSSLTFGNNQSTDAFSVRKTIAITTYFMEKGSRQAKQGLDLILKEAIHRNSWEDVRSIDYYLALYQKDESLVLKLYFGTSLICFRERLRRHFPNLTIPDIYHRRLGGASLGKVPLFDPENSMSKPGKALQKLVSALVSDSYRPFTGVELFERVFAGEFYQCNVSESKVYALIRRLRCLFERESLPFVINNEAGLIGLSSRSAIDVLIPENVNPLLTQFDHRIKHLKSLFIGKTFTMNDVMSVFDISRSLATQLVKEGVDGGLLKREGFGNKVKYFICDSFTAQEKRAA